jgi:phospholipid N-methyltransferase
MPIGETNPLRIIGAFAPSSRRLACAMTRHVEGDHILEVGAGSGAITKALEKKMRLGQNADVVEYFAKLAALLRLRFWDQRSIAIHSGDILHFDAQPNSYDAIICSLPFNAFSPETTEAILEKLIDLAKDGAIMSFFEYKILQGMAKMLLPKKGRAQFLASQHLIDLFCRRYKFAESVVNLNFPPAIVHYLRIDKSGSRPSWRA